MTHVLQCAPNGYSMVQLGIFALLSELYISPRVATKICFTKIHENLIFSRENVIKKIT